MMRSLATLLAVASLAAAPAPASPVPDASASPAPSSSPCAVPNRPASVARRTTPPAPPQPPPLAEQQGISGVVSVLVSLDAQGVPVKFRIQDSPSAILNATALADARRAKYEPALQNCVPVPSEYLFTVSFGGR